ncbi:hypothetical protein ACFL1T_02235 [Chlamydiota bacterium]
MQVRYHTLITAIAAGIFFCITKSTTNSIILFISGVFIDLDHVIDYLIYLFETKQKKCSIEHLFETCEEKKLYHVFLIFHSYELPIIGWILYFLTDRPLWLFATLFGISLHILLDVIHNPVRLLLYSFISRAFHQFNADIFYIKKDTEK